MKAPFSALILLLAGILPTSSWTVPSRVTYRLPQSITRRTPYATRLYAQEQQDDHDAALKEAQRLKEKAEKARLEAQEMEKTFVEQKLATLEKLLEKQSTLSSSEQQDMQDKIDRLKNYQKPREEIETIDLSNTTAEDLLGLAIDEMQVAQEEFVPVGELSEEDREAVEEIQSIFMELQGTLNDTFSDRDEELTEAFAELGQDLENALAGNIAREDLDMFKDVTSFLDNFPGVKKGQLKEQFLKGTKEFAKEMAEIQEMEKVDPYYSARIGLIQELIPEEMQSSSVKVNQTDIDEFVNKVMKGNEDVFEMKSKPRKVGSYYILEGTTLADDGNVLVDQLDKQLLASGGLQNKLQYFYIRDPSALVGLDEVQLADMIQEGSDNVDLKMLQKADKLEPPSLLVMHAKTKAVPTSVTERTLWTGLALLSIACFAGSYYDPDGNALDHIFTGLSNPTVLFGLLGLSLVHELGHFAAATLNKVRTRTKLF